MAEQQRSSSVSTHPRGRVSTGSFGERTPFDAPIRAYISQPSRARCSPLLLLLLLQAVETFLEAFFGPIYETLPNVSLRRCCRCGAQRGIHSRDRDGARRPHHAGRGLPRFSARPLQALHLLGKAR